MAKSLSQKIARNTFDPREPGFPDAVYSGSAETGGNDMGKEDWDEIEDPGIYGNDAEETPSEEEEQPTGEISAEEGSADEIEQPPSRMLPTISPYTAQRAGEAAAGGLSRLSDFLEPPPSAAAPSDTLEANGDDLSDLFEGPQEDDLDINVDDLVDVDEEDIFGDGGEEGLSDLVDVPEDVFLNDIEDAGVAAPSRRLHRAPRTTLPPMGISGIQ
jgi:hypothetical protein